MVCLAVCTWNGHHYLAVYLYTNPGRLALDNLPTIVGMAGESFVSLA
jgi:hypothetical protein